MRMKQVHDITSQTVWAFFICMTFSSSSQPWLVVYSLLVQSCRRQWHSRRFAFFPTSARRLQFLYSDGPPPYPKNGSPGFQFTKRGMWRRLVRTAAPPNQRRQNWWIYLRGPHRTKRQMNIMIARWVGLSQGFWDKDFCTLPVQFKSRRWKGGPSYTRK